MDCLLPTDFAMLAKNPSYVYCKICLAALARHIEHDQNAGKRLKEDQAASMGVSECFPLLLGPGATSF